MFDSFLQSKQDCKVDSDIIAVWKSLIKYQLLSAIKTLFMLGSAVPFTSVLPHLTSSYTLIICIECGFPLIIGIINTICIIVIRCCNTRGLCHGGCFIIACEAFPILGQY